MTEKKSGSALPEPGNLVLIGTREEFEKTLAELKEQVKSPEECRELFDRFFEKRQRVNVRLK